MTRDSVLEWLMRRPFHPFEMHLSNGERYEVRHPENLALSLTNAIVVLPDSDRSAKIALLHVASIDELESASAGGR
jgi:hypothetical protein